MSSTVCASSMYMSLPPLQYYKCKDLPQSSLHENVVFIFEAVFIFEVVLIFQVVFIFRLSSLLRLSSLQLVFIFEVVFIFEGVFIFEVVLIFQVVVIFQFIAFYILKIQLETLEIKFLSLALLNQAKKSECGTAQPSSKHLVGKQTR